MSVIIETSLGEFTVDLFYEKCPNACKNFLKLCKIKYYNNSVFYGKIDNSRYIKKFTHKNYKIRLTKWKIYFRKLIF